MKLQNETYTFEDVLEKNGAFVYTSIGTSMLPLLREKRDIIEIRAKENERCKKYDVVLYKRGNKYILHRIIKVRPTDYVIIGDNCIKKEYGINDNQIIGVMTRIFRNGKIITPNNIIYKIFVYCWVNSYHIRIAILHLKLFLYRITQKIKKAIRKKSA